MQFAKISLLGVALLLVGYLTNIVNASPVNSTKPHDIAATVDMSIDTANFCIASGFSCIPSDAKACCSGTCKYAPLHGFKCAPMNVENESHIEEVKESSVDTLFPRQDLFCIGPGGSCPPDNRFACCSCQCLFTWFSGYVCGSGDECTSAEAKSAATLDALPASEVVNDKEEIVNAEGVATNTETTTITPTERTVEEDQISSGGIETLEGTEDVEAANVDVELASASPTCVPDRHYCAPIKDGQCCSRHCMYTMWYGYICADSKTAEAEIAEAGGKIE